MEININCELAGELARQLRTSRAELTQRWLERIAARVAIDPNRIFPSDDMLDHVPVLMDGIADYLENPADEISADVPVIAKAIELGQLRHEQGFGAHEIMKEYEILGGVLFAFLVRIVDSIDEQCTRGELLACAHRLFRAIAVIQQVTTIQYLTLAQEQVGEREKRLRSFNRMVSHELKNHLGALLGASQLIGEEWVQKQPDQLSRFAQIVVKNAGEMQGVLQDLLSLSRTDVDVRQQRHVMLRKSIAEVVRQLREFALRRKVEVRISGEIPEVEVNAAVVELCLSNYLSNAIKYSDDRVAERWVEVSASLTESGAAGRELVVAVRDNGRGVPAESRGRLFQRFFRAHDELGEEVEGTGLGLSIVRDTVESAGGRAWAEFSSERGSSFKIALPHRRGREGPVGLPG